MVPSDADLRSLADRLGYRFKEIGRLRLALTHRSAVLGAEGSNERLEFLGDTVLDLCLSEALLDQFPKADSGELTKLKALHVSNEHLAGVANSLGLAEFLQVGGGQRLVGDRTEKRILANAFEAVLAAVYLDGDIAAAKNVVACCMLSDGLSGTLDRSPDEGNHKAALQEWIQARHLALPRYSVVRTEGSVDRPTFYVEARCEALTGTGSGPKKRAAENEAAQDLLRLLIESESRKSAACTKAAVHSGV